MADESDGLEEYPLVCEVRAFVRQPKLQLSGNVLQFYIPRDSAFADAALIFGTKNLHDCEVGLVIRLMKKADGSDARGRGDGVRPPG